MGNKRLGQDNKLTRLDHCDTINIAENEYKSRSSIGQLLEYGRTLNLLKAECKEIKRFVKCKLVDLSLMRFEKEMVELDYRLTIAKEESKRVEAAYSLSITIPTGQKICELKRASRIKMLKVEAETRALVYAIKQLGAAQICLNYSVPLTEARCSRSLGEALSQYYIALILDKISKYFLIKLAKTFDVHPEFKFKLERPLVIIDKQKMIESVRSKGIK